MKVPTNDAALNNMTPFVFIHLYSNALNGLGFLQCNYSGRFSFCAALGGGMREVNGDTPNPGKGTASPCTPCSMETSIEFLGQGLDVVGSTGYMCAGNDLQFYVFFLGCFTAPDAAKGFFTSPDQCDLARIRGIAVACNYPVK